MKIFKLLLITIAFPSFLFAQTDFEKQVNTYAGMLAEKITLAGKTKIAVSDFLDNNGNITELGKVIAEELGINIANTGKGFQVMERENLNAILKEHQLVSTGLIDPETAKKLGKLKAVDAVIVGTVFPFGDNLKVNIKILDTETGMSIGGTTGSIARTDAINKLYENKLGSVSQTINTDSVNKGPKKPEVDTLLEVGISDMRENECVKWKINAYLFFGQACFKNQTDHDLLLIIKDVWGTDGQLNERMFIPKGGTICSPIIEVGAEPITIRDLTFTFTTTTYPYKTGTFFLPLEKCKVKSVVLTNKNLYLE